MLKQLLFISSILIFQCNFGMHLDQIAINEALRRREVAQQWNERLANHVRSGSFRFTPPSQYKAQQIEIVESKKRPWWHYFICCGRRKRNIKSNTQYGTFNR